MSLDDYSEPKKYNYDRMEWVKKNLSKRDNLYEIGLENLRVLVYQLGLFNRHILTDEKGIEIKQIYKNIATLFCKYNIIGIS